MTTYFERITELGGAGVGVGAGDDPGATALAEEALEVTLVPDSPARLIVAERVVAAPDVVSEAPALPQFDLGIDRVRRGAVVSHSWGDAKNTAFHMSDGSSYRVRDYIPNDIRGSRLVTMTTPWFTDIEGFNDFVGVKFAEAGIRTHIVSPEQSNLVKSYMHVTQKLAEVGLHLVDLDINQLPIPKRFLDLGHTSLAHDVVVHHLLLDYEEEHEQVDTHALDDTGYSRGAMIGFGKQAYASEYGRTFVNAGYTDPCLIRAVRLGEVVNPNIPLYVMKELARLALVVRPSSWQEARAVVPTFARSLGFYVSQVATGISLFSGETGTFVDQMPGDTQAHVTLFTDSEFNQVDEYETHLAAYPNITVSREKGVHFSGANRRVINDTRRRLLAGQGLAD